MSGSIEAAVQTRRSIARRGAALGLKLSCAYSAVFVLYSLVHSTVALAGARPSAGAFPTLAATWLSLIVASIAFAALLAPVVAGIGASSALAIEAVVRRARPSTRGAMITGILICLGFSAALLAIVHLGLGVGAPTRFLRTYAFWLGVPIALYVAAGASFGGSLALERRGDRARIQPQSPGDGSAATPAP